MPQSLAQVMVHIVVSTKGRTPWLNEGIQPEMFSYLATVVRNAGHTVVSVGGHTDHVHILIGLSRTETIARTVEVLKTSSSKWIKTKGETYHEFAWQRGYGAFGVSFSAVPAVVSYIANQPSHHHVVSFQDELRQLMIENGIEIDERYIWD